nr:merzoite surface protein 1 [Ipomoea trifida]
MTKNMQFCHFCVTLILIWLLVLNFPNTNAARGNPSKLLPPPRTSHNSPSALTQTPPSNPDNPSKMHTPVRTNPNSPSALTKTPPSRPSAVTQRPPTSAKNHISYSSILGCNEPRAGSCIKSPPRQYRCDFENRSCNRRP